MKTDVKSLLDQLNDAKDRRELFATYEDAWSAAVLRHLGGRAISSMSQMVREFLLPSIDLIFFFKPLAPSSIECTYSGLGEGGNWQANAGDDETKGVRFRNLTSHFSWQVSHFAETILYEVLLFQSHDHVIDLDHSVQKE